MSHGSYKHKGYKHKELVDYFHHMLCPLCCLRFMTKRWRRYLPEGLFVKEAIDISVVGKLLLLSFTGLVGLSFFDSSRRWETIMYWFDELYTLENDWDWQKNKQKLSNTYLDVKLLTGRKKLKKSVVSVVEVSHISIFVRSVPLMTVAGREGGRGYY